MAAMIHLYNKTSGTLCRGATSFRVYNKTRGGGLASAALQGGPPEQLDDGNGCV